MSKFGIVDDAAKALRTAGEGEGAIGDAARAAQKLLGEGGMTERPTLTADGTKHWKPPKRGLPMGAA